MILPKKQIEKLKSKFRTNGKQPKYPFREMKVGEVRDLDPSWNIRQVQLAAATTKFRHGTEFKVLVDKNVLVRLK